MTSERTMTSALVRWPAEERQAMPLVVDMQPPAPRPMSRGLIVDLDDTLYPQRQFMESGFRAVALYLAAQHGLDARPLAAALLRSLEAGESRHAFQRLCAAHGLPETDVPLMLQVFREHQPVLTLDDGVAVTLRRLRNAGWRIAILTNGLPSVQERKLQALGLPALVDHIIYAEQHAATGKPAAEPFRQTLSRLRMRAGRSVCIGDDPIKDIGGARALGIRTIRVARFVGAAFRRPEGQKDLAVPRRDADAVVESFNEVPLIAAALLDKAASHAA
jgi:putative hydrolase of the HAD superfamily